MIFGRVTAEAVLAGTPVVGARSGATPELIRDHRDGPLYELGDHRDLARKIENLIQHPEEAREMGESGRARASREFTVQRYTESVYRLLRDLVR